MLVNVEPGIKFSSPPFFIASNSIKKHNLEIKKARVQVLVPCNGVVRKPEAEYHYD